MTTARELTQLVRQAAWPQGDTRGGARAAPAELPADLLQHYYWREGKGQVDALLLGTLLEVRRHVAVGRLVLHPSEAAFLEMLVDRPAGTYGYGSYLGLELVLRLTEPPAGCSLEEYFAVRAGQIALVLESLARFEEMDDAAAAEEPTRLRPPAELLARRVAACRRATAQLPKLGYAGTASVDPAWTRCVKLSLLPMTNVHDERAFIRVLQAGELVFSMALRGVRGAIEALAEDGSQAEAERALRATALAVGVGTGLFRVLTTMPRSHFRAFREATMGASALGSAQFKLLELLCRPPDVERLGEGSYAMVPDVARLLPDATLEELVAGVQAEPPLVAALDEVNRAWRAWKRAHYGVARRWVEQEEPGTGGTDGLSYLARDRDRVLVGMPVQLR